MLTKNGGLGRWTCLLGAAGMVALILGVGSCGSSAAPEAETLDVTCSGKCDGWGSIKSLYSDAKNLDLGDLLHVGAGFATDELNDALEISDFGGISFKEPELYAPAAVAENDLTLKNIDKLVSGLVTQFGERELTTEVNALRAAHLASSGDIVYGESAFKIDAHLRPSWGFETGGLAEDQEATASVGFGFGQTLEARVIGAYGGEPSATFGAPLAALKQARGFILPRSVSDLSSMKPGESFALRGVGTLGINLGAGVPILIAEPASAITYNLVVSAAIRTALEGTMDVQLVRVGGDEVVVDVGVENAFVRLARIALEDGWGVEGLVESNVQIGSIDIDLGHLIDRAVQRELNKKLNFISARAEKIKKNMRLSVVRLRFSLGEAAANPAVEQALAQALKGDVRLAQALSNRGEAGVHTAFDLTRAGVSATSYAGIDIFGMSFFRETIEGQGSVVVQTPGGARTILFDSLHRDNGWFFSNHGYTRVGLSGLVFDPQASTLPAGEANLFLQVEEGDDYMERDKLLDHLDGVIVAVGGPEALTAIEEYGNELERYVIGYCPNSQAFDPCRVEVLSTATVIQLRADGEAALAAVVGHLDASQQNLVLAAGRLRLTAQATYEPIAQLAGPPTSIVLDGRLDDGALAEVMTEDNKFQLRNSLLAYLKAVGIERDDTVGEIMTDRASIEGRNANILDNLATIFDDHSARYERLLAAERAVIENLGEVGPRAIEIRFPVDADNRPLYEEATARSLSQARAQVATAMFDALVDEAKALDPHPEQTISYALLSLTSSPRIDLRLDIDMDLDDNWAQGFEQYRAAGYASFDEYGRGSAVSPIDGGLFSVDAFIKLD